ncbi:MAG: YeeE/YedE thiosulfate transporter family protein [Bacteroidales bacterium]|nr:YeeE/YedE thiosulfate transporter family protein [Bacteroidales bacterium]
MEKVKHHHEVKPYMNPYLAGFLLGLVLLLTFFITGRGLGASGAIKSSVITLVGKISPANAEASHFFSEYFGAHSPMKSWLVFEVIGMLIGAFLSGFLSGRLHLKVDKGPQIKTYTRLAFALTGGMLFGIGSQLGRGCTSGAALSGMAVFSTAGFLTMMAIFGTGYVIAYFFRKLWI